VQNLGKEKPSIAYSSGAIVVDVLALRSLRMVGTIERPSGEF
jgi:hypothetical protein